MEIILFFKKATEKVYITLTTAVKINFFVCPPIIIDVLEFGSITYEKASYIPCVPKQNIVHKLVELICWPKY